jgi:hypothetical protein
MLTSLATAYEPKPIEAKRSIGDRGIRMTISKRTTLKYGKVCFRMSKRNMDELCGNRLSWNVGQSGHHEIQKSITKV